jgi:hypothetical protein
MHTPLPWNSPTLFKYTISADAAAVHHTKIHVPFFMVPLLRGFIRGTSVTALLTFVLGT